MGVAFVVTQMAGPATGSIELVQTDNRVQFHAGGSAQWRDVSGPQSLEPGDRLRTGPGGFALIEFPRGVSVRVDNTSEFELLADDRLYLDAGAVYVDAAGPGSMQIATEHGTARDIGTRFEVRLVDEGWQVSVRDGAVVLRDGDRGEARALAGERLTVAGGELRRDSVGPADASWRWTHSALRPMEIEGRMLSSYLTWWSRESGVEVVYAKPIDSSIAAQTRLHGDLGGLSLEAGFDAVIAGTGFRVLDRDMQRVIVTN
jgi:hypothetical protein